MGTELRRGESRPSDETLPQVLGLHAPFRSFGREKTDMEMNKDPARPSRKRKRKHSSASSYLEPATFLVHKGVADNGGDQTKASVSQGHHGEQNDSASQSSSDFPDTPVIRSIPQEQPNKYYQRRSRHKTREDRYELKQVKETKKRKKKKERGAPKNERKRKRKEKSGAALMHDFTAQNVVHDRLTVRLLLMRLLSLKLYRPY